MKSATVIEIVGPAGSGKTTAAVQIAACVGARLIESVSPAESRARRWLAAIQAMPRALRFAASGRTTRRQLAWLGRLVALRSLVRRTDGEVVVLDQGPLYTLSRLFAARPDRAGDGWGTRQVTEWSRLLALVVVLDAPDHVLVERIRTREKDHAVKSSLDSDARVAVARQRAELERVVLAAEAGGLAIVRFRTDELTAEQIAAEVTSSPRRSSHGSPWSGRGST